MLIDIDLLPCSTVHNGSQTRIAGAESQQRKHDLRSVRGGHATMPVDYIRTSSTAQAGFVTRRRAMVRKPEEGVDKGRQC